jgi:sulfate adenylyltransferase
VTRPVSQRPRTTDNRWGGCRVWHDWPVPAPQYCPSPRELDDLELLLNGAFAPLRTFEADGPVALELPEELAAADVVDLVDPEGLPLARLSGSELSALSSPSHGPFRRLHLSPEEVRSQHPEALTVPVAGALTDADLDAITTARAGRPVVLLALTGAGTPQGLTSVGLLRAALAAAALLGDTHVVAVPLPSHGDPTVDHELGQRVVANYAPGEVLAPTGAGDLPGAVADVVEHDQPAERGVVVFFTGLSGSGKSTLAQALNDLVLEAGERTVTSLDGDVVRRNLSAGLTFSREDRETNIRRIGWVAAEIARHRGIAICSPIAPFDATRQQVRQMVEAAGGDFVLVHVATPLEECERRDRKGLYAKARAGEIPEFTGISSPYEEPADATVRVDTTGRTIEDALADVLAALPFSVPSPTGTPTLETGDR